MKNLVCPSKLRSEHTSPRSFVAARYLFAILLTLAPCAAAAQMRPSDSATAKAERVGLNLRDSESAAAMKQPDSETDPATRERLRHTVLLSMKGSAAGPGAVVGYDAFMGTSSRHFLRAPEQTIQAPKLSAPRIPALKGFSLSVSPRVSLKKPNPSQRPQFPDVQGPYPRDLQGNLASSKFGVFSSGVGRLFGMRLVIEKK